MKRFVRAIGIDDVVAVIGLATLGAGVWMIYPPAALIVVGVALIAFAFWRL